MKRLILTLLLIVSSLAFSQNKKTEKILNEGKLLYRLEKGSWYGTDDMLARFKTKRDSVGGYLSYETADKNINTIFFSRFDNDRILIRYAFDSMPKPQPIKIDTINQKATELEKNLIKIRQDAKERAFSEKDTFFSFYENTLYNFIPVITDKERNVFILTGTNALKAVLIGNDYKLSYNRKFEFERKEKIHNSILQFPFASEEEDEEKTITTFHSHVITEYISSTDICTLLLYKDFVDWNQHIVISEKEVSIFDLEKESLFTMKREAWEKIYDQEKEKD
ncbi:hypothetical protein A7A78_08805 [Aequorivita soesokkakensis]|uniref:Uncharacterized protein n=1 Tax=Aequorivita soesokkakensis TaxID=1385699 RepID=A0A1A9LIJ3_9FLAO|nr:hypothetical protein [Aequorivita soesokkakensis]OAD92325.1 hypothetical protein A7A78_08805 [Aequorivita soesokkakensis]